VAGLPDSISVEVPNGQPQSFALPAVARSGPPVSKSILLKIRILPGFVSKARVSPVSYSVGTRAAGSLFDVTVSPGFPALD
jgi:hypothetical protein